MAKTYLEKKEIKPVGVSKVRTFGGPVDLKVFDKADGVTDNFPLGLTAFDLFGAVIQVVDDNKTVAYIADEVYEEDGKVYFKLGTTQAYYDKAVGRLMFA